MKKNRIFIIIICLIVITLTVIPLGNKYRYVINRDKINAFIKKYESGKVYIGSFPFFTRFSGYVTRNPIELENEKFYEVELKCSLNADTTKLEISLLKVNSRYPSGEPRDIIVIGKHTVKGNNIIKYLKEGIPDKIIKTIEGYYIEQIR